MPSATSYAAAVHGHTEGIVLAQVSSQSVAVSVTFLHDLLYVIGNLSDRSHERKEWLDAKIRQAKRTTVGPVGEQVTTFDFVVGERCPVSVCEAAFFRAADISGGSRSSAMSAARTGRDRRMERLGEYRPPRQAVKKEEILNWQVHARARAGRGLLPNPLTVLL